MQYHVAIIRINAIIKRRAPLIDRPLNNVCRLHSLAYFIYSQFTELLMCSWEDAFLANLVNCGIANSNASFADSESVWVHPIATRLSDSSVNVMAPPYCQTVSSFSMSRTQHYIRAYNNNNNNNNNNSNNNGPQKSASTRSHSEAAFLTNVTPSGQSSNCLIFVFSHRDLYYRGR